MKLQMIDQNSDVLQGWKNGWRLKKIYIHINIMKSFRKDMYNSVIVRVQCAGAIRNTLCKNIYLGKN